MSMWEYEARVRAKELKDVDEDFLLHKFAWLNREIKAEKKSGKSSKPVYRKFEQFFDYKKRLRDVVGGNKEGFSEIGRKIVEKRRREKNGGKLRSNRDI